MGPNKSSLLLGFESLIDPEPDPFDSQLKFRKLLVSLSSASLGRVLSVPLAPDSLFQITEALQSSIACSARSFNQELTLPLLKKSDPNSDEVVRQNTSDDICSQTEVTYWPLRRSLSEELQEFSILLVPKRNSGYRTVFKEFKIMPWQVLHWT